MLNKNSSFKKMTNTYKNSVTKNKNSGLLLTDFNKYPLVRSKAKTSKKKSYINHQDYNNYLKMNNKKFENDLNNNEITENFNYIYENMAQKIGFNLENDKTKNQNGIKNINENYKSNKETKNDNNLPKHTNELMKCNSVNNLIGININVNYMNKNYSIKKLKHSSKKINCDNSCGNISKNTSNINNNNNFSEINNENLPNSSSSKAKLNKKEILILNPTNQDWEKIIENLKSKKIKESKLNLNENLKTEKFFQNFIVNNNTNTSTDEINIYSKTNSNIIGKSSSCKNINYIKTQKGKNSTNKYINLYQGMNKKINQLKLKKEKNNDFDSIYNNKLLKILNEYFIEYNKLLEDHNQKKLIKEIFQQINKIIKSKEEEIINIKKENEELLKINKSLKSKNEELIIYNNNKDEYDNSYNKKGSFISSSNNNENDDSSSVNSEELESIRFFDKIIMKKHSFSNIPELSFKKLNKNINEKNNDIPIKNNNIKKKHSFQENNNRNKEIKNCKLNNKNYFEIKKKNINNKNKRNDNSQILFQKRNIIEKIERNKPNIKSFINIFEKSRNKK